MMRVNPDYGSNIIHALSTVEHRVETALEQLSSGKRVNRPSDDPAASAALLDNHSRTRMNDQFRQNIVTTRAMLQTADSSLGQVVTRLTRAVTIGTQGATGTLSTLNRKQLATEVSGVLQQVLQLANTSFRGIYLFAGSETTSPPFVVDSASNSGYTYRGNETTNQVPISPGRSVTIGVPGNSIFMAQGNDSFGALQSLVSALEGDDVAVIATATSAVRDALENVSQQRVFYGSTLSDLEAQEVCLQEDKLNLKSEETEMIGADIAGAAIAVNETQTMRSAVLAAVAKFMPASLLDYLR